MSDLPERDEDIINKELFGTRPPPRVHFYLHGARNEPESVAAGYPVFMDRVYITLKIPDSADFMSHPATPAEIRQYPEAYKLFERGRSWNQHPLELLPSVTPALLATAQALGLYTIEQIASHAPETAPWLQRSEDGSDPFPALQGQLPPALLAVQTQARRYVSFCKPRMRLVDGKLEAA